jgi:hypothetical protein
MVEYGMAIIGEHVDAFFMESCQPTPVLLTRGKGSNMETCWHPCHYCSIAPAVRGPYFVAHDVIGVINAFIIVQGQEPEGEGGVVGNRAAPILERHFVYGRASQGPRLLAQVSNTVTAGLSWVWRKQ